jgi:glucokinase
MWQHWESVERVSAAGEMLLNGVQEYFNKFASPKVRTSTKMKLAQLGNDAGVIGAASLVKHSRKCILD